MACFQYKKFNCFKLSILNYSHTISWTQRLNWFSFTSVYLTASDFFLLLQLRLFIVHCRFRSGGNGFFTNCLYGHHDAMINMTQQCWVAALIYFQVFGLLHRPPTSQSILLKCSVSRTTVETNGSFPDAVGVLYLQSWVCQPSMAITLLALKHVYSSSFCLWIRGLGLGLDFNL